MSDIKNVTDFKKILVLSKTARILDYVTQCKKPESISKMSADLQIPRGTLYRLLEALEEEEILTQSSEGYQIGPRLLGWAVEAFNSSDLRQIARPYMVKLSEEFGLSVSLYICGHDSRICLERIEGRGVIRPAVKIGEHLPLHLCASGTALIAWLPAQEREKVLEASRKRFPESQVINRDEDWWPRIRRQGWVLTIGERDPELAGVAAPIFDRDGNTIASLVISGSRYQFTESDLDIGYMANQLLACVGQIHKSNGGKEKSS